jgi:hypothetical protein
MRTDRETDMTRQIVAFRSLANAPDLDSISSSCTSSIRPHSCKSQALRCGYKTKKLALYSRQRCYRRQSIYWPELCRVAAISPRHTGNFSYTCLLRVSMTFKCRGGVHKQFPAYHKKLTVAHMVNIFPVFYKRRMFITVFTTASHLTISPTTPIRPKPSRYAQNTFRVPCIETCIKPTSELYTLRSVLCE